MPGPSSPALLPRKAGGEGSEDFGWFIACQDFPWFRVENIFNRPGRGSRRAQNYVESYGSAGASPSRNPIPQTIRLIPNLELVS